MANFYNDYSNYN